MKRSLKMAVLFSNDLLYVTLNTQTVSTSTVYTNVPRLYRVTATIPDGQTVTVADSYTLTIT